MDVSNNNIAINNTSQQSLPVKPPIYTLAPVTQQPVNCTPVPTTYYQPPAVYPSVQQYNKLANTQKLQNAVTHTAQTNPPLPSLTSLANTFSVFIDKAKKSFSEATTQVTAPNKSTQSVIWKNDLRTMFQNNQAVIYALIIRTFNAKGNDGDDLVSPDKGGKTGTFISAIDRLDELKSLGINTLHLLPITPPGKERKLGNAGSVYAPLDFLQIDPKLRDPNAPGDVKEQAKRFINECHKRGISVMLDLPSCGSIDFYEAHPDLVAKNDDGTPKIPQGWFDIRMLQPWQDEDKKILNEKLYKMHQQFIDMCIDLGVDGIRADVARAKPPEFWNNLIHYARSKDPNFAFLAETYTYEDASPMSNVPADRPTDDLKAGFDSYYGQYHNFHDWRTAKEFQDYVTDNLKMSTRLPAGKSLIGSFTTHDDKSAMSHGGVIYCDLTTGLQATLPMVNPYFVSGFESGDRYVYAFANKNVSKGHDNYHVDPEKLDLFNFSRKPGGDHPEIGQFMSKMFEVRKEYQDVITRGSYIPLKVDGNKDDLIIAYARHINGKTILVIANKDVNARQTGKIEVPTLKANQVLKDLAPSYGIESEYSPENGAVNVDLGPARFHMFEIDTPDIETHSEHVYKQNLNGVQIIQPKKPELATA